MIYELFAWGFLTLVVVGGTVLIGCVLRAMDADHERAVAQHFGRGLDALGRASERRGPGVRRG